MSRKENMSRTRFTQAFDLHNMVPGPASNAVPQVIYKSEDGIMLCYGTTAVNAAPLTTAGLYAPGCLYIKALTAGSSILYLNTGTKASPSWTDQK